MKKEEKWENMKYVMSLLMRNSLKIAKKISFNFFINLSSKALR